MPGPESMPHRMGAVTICLAILLFGGCASTKDQKPKFLAVPVTFERHLEAVRNCKPIGAMTYFDKDIPDEENLLGLVFALHTSSRASTTHRTSAGNVWRETSSRMEDSSGIRLFKCPSEFLKKVSVEMRGESP